MSFKIDPQGNIVVDTLEEARQVQEMILQNGTAQPKKQRRPRKGTTATANLNGTIAGNRTFEALLGDMAKTAKDALIAVAASQNGLTTQELAEAIHVERSSLPPIIRGIKTVARRHGFQEKEILETETISIERRPATRYKVGPGAAQGLRQNH